MSNRTKENNMKTLRLNLYSDPGHAWVKVSYKKLLKFGVAPSISHYSYMRGENVYLEEDSDLSKFIKAANENGYTVTFKSHSTNRYSKIRSYQRYFYVANSQPLEIVDGAHRVFNS